MPKIDHSTKSPLINAITRIASHNNTVIRHDQLIRLGATQDWIERQVRLGWLHVIHPGVYLVGSATPTDPARLTAAACAGGPGAMLIGFAGAVCWEMLRPSRITGPIEVATHTHRRTTQAVAMRRMGWITPADRRRRGGCPVASRAVVIVSLADRLCEEELISLLDHADFRERTVVRDIDRILCERGQIRGRVRLLRAIERFRAGDTGAASGYELDVDRELAAIGAPSAVLNPVLILPSRRTIKVDRYWAKARLVAEADGPPHERERQQAVDPLRDERLAEAGIEVIRVPSDWDPTARRQLLEDVAERARELRSGPAIKVVRRARMRG